jgi:hypothetical protein
MTTSELLLNRGRLAIVSWTFVRVTTAAASAAVPGDVYATRAAVTVLIGAIRTPVAVGRRQLQQAPLPSDVAPNQEAHRVHA